MVGSMIGKLNTHFKDFMLNHWKQNITIKHLVSEAINADTGVKTKVENIFYPDAIVERLTKKDLEMFPNVFSVHDRKAFFSSDEGSIEKGDSVIIITDGSYIVHEYEVIDELYKVYLKRI